MSSVEVGVSFFDEADYFLLEVCNSEESKNPGLVRMNIYLSNTLVDLYDEISDVFLNTTIFDKSKRFHGNVVCVRHPAEFRANFSLAKKMYSGDDLAAATKMLFGLRQEIDELTLRYLYTHLGHEFMTRLCGWAKDKGKVVDDIDEWDSDEWFRKYLYELFGRISINADLNKFSRASMALTYARQTLDPTVTLNSVSDSDLAVCIRGKFDGFSLCGKEVPVDEPICAWYMSTTGMWQGERPAPYYYNGRLLHPFLADLFILGPTVSVAMLEELCVKHGFSIKYDRVVNITYNSKITAREWLYYGGGNLNVEELAPNILILL